MTKLKDLTGKRFGRLTVIERAENNKRGRTRWLCKCDCGNEKIGLGYSLTHGDLQSCGCLHKERFKQKPLELKGKKFGRLTVLEKTGTDKSRLNKWLCKCECGNEVTVRSSQLKNGKTTSCGCYNKERISETKKTHGMTDSDLYRVWNSMNMRCGNPNTNSYERYGGRGIKVCERWKSFENFLEDMGEGYKKGLSIERINTNGNYEPENCRWATMMEQQNNRRNNRLLTAFGETLTMAEASRKFNINYGTLKRRLKSGWSVEEAVTIPVGGKRK